MDAIVIQQQRPFDATAKLRGSSASVVPDARKPRTVDAVSGDKDIALDPAALRARLKHRAPPSTGSSNVDYNNVLDTARRLAELERQRAQDAAYIRTLEHTRATLQRDAQTAASTAAARARAEAEAEVEARSVAMRAAEAESAAVAVGRERARAERAEERARAERAEERARALERVLEEVRERVLVLEGVVESERRRREEWECGLETLALGGGLGGGGGSV